MTVTEAWANPANVPATVAAGAPAVPAGTGQAWVMGGGWAEFTPPADPAARPPVIFRVFDLNAPGEVILVTDSRTATWQVTRGDQGTTPADHAAGFAVHNVITRDGLANFAQGVPSGNGLVLPAAGRRAVTEGAFTNEVFTVSELPVPAFEATPGSVYELLAFGYFWTGSGLQNLHAEITWNDPGRQALAARDWQLIPNPPGIVPGNPTYVPPTRPPAGGSRRSRPDGGCTA